VSGRAGLSRNDANVGRCGQAACRSGGTVAPNVGIDTEATRVLVAACAAR
jgi:hypothetical protein